MTVFHYSLGRRVLASDSGLPYLARAAAPADLTLRLRDRAQPPAGARAWYRAGTIIDKADDGTLLMRFSDATAFAISADGRAIALVDAPPHYTRDDLAAYALGPVLGVALHLQGALLVHAAAVVLGGRALLVSGGGGRGKSTTAAILARQGAGFLSDDLLEIDGDLALPSLPCLRLSPDVVTRLYGDAAAFPDRAPSWEKKLVRVDTADAHPIGAILFLDAERNATPHLERLAPRDGWRRLIADCYTARLPDERMARAIFDATSALANRVPMFRFVPPELAQSANLAAFLERALS